MSLINNSTLNKIINDEDESIIQSYQIIKINKNKSKQQRNLILTNKFLYNIRKPNIINESISFFKKSFLVKRQIELHRINIVVYSTKSWEMVLLVDNEYDYNLYFTNWDNFIIDLYKARETLNLKSLKFIFTKQLQLGTYTTHNS